MSFPLIVRETTGPGRTIVLQGRSLPYRPVSWGGTQRVNINYFPGNPVASAQVIGQTYKPTVMKGKWKDAFLLTGLGAGLQPNSPKLINFPSIGLAGLPAVPGIARQGETFPSAGSIPGLDQVAQRARVVRDAFELIRRSGQLLRVEWGSVVRYGFLVDAEYDHDREEDIAFQLEFAWTGDTDVPPKVSLLPVLDPGGLLKKLAKLLQKLLDVLLEAFLKVAFAVLGVQQQIRQIGSLVTGLIEVLQKFASLALVPGELIGSVAQQLTAIALACKDLVDQLRGTPAAYVELANGAKQSAVNIAQALSQAVQFNASQLGAQSIEQKREIERLQEPNLLGVFISPGGVTLRDVSTRFYGTPDSWTLIAEFNGLSSSTVPQGTAIRIPRRE